MTLLLLIEDECVLVGRSGDAEGLAVRPEDDSGRARRSILSLLRPLESTGIDQLEAARDRLEALNRLRFAVQGDERHRMVAHAFAIDVVDRHPDAALDPLERGDVGRRRKGWRARIVGRLV